MEFFQRIKKNRIAFMKSRNQYDQWEAENDWLLRLEENHNCSEGQIWLLPIWNCVIRKTELERPHIPGGKWVANNSDIILLGFKWRQDQIYATENLCGFLVEVNDEVIFLTGFYNATVDEVRVLSAMKAGMISWWQGFLFSKCTCNSLDFCSISLCVGACRTEQHNI